MRPHATLMSTPVALVVAGAVLAACGNGGSAGTDPDTAQATDASSAPVSQPADPAATADSSSPTPRTALPADATAEQRLLDAGQLPGFNDEWSWAVGSTTPVAPRTFGRCARFDTLSIGAVDGVQRTYTDSTDPHSGNVAAMQVIEFPDPKTAQRATAVLKSWHTDCEQRLKASLRPSTVVRVGELQDVPVAAGTGSWYVAHWSIPGEADDHHFQAFGMATAGQRMALLRMDNIGQDRNYDQGQDPMHLAVTAAAARL